MITQHTDQTHRTHAQRFARLAVFALPLILVNLIAIYGQTLWFAANLTNGSYPLAASFALTVESVAVFLAFEAHVSALAGDAALRLRLSSYAVALLVAGLNYSHFAAPGFRPTTTALVFAFMSASSPWLWSIRSRSLRRSELRAAGLIDVRTARFAVAKIINFPVRTLGAYRWSVDRGIINEREAWEAFRRERRNRKAGITDDSDLEAMPVGMTKADALRHAFDVLGVVDVQAALEWLDDRGVTVNRSHAYAIARAENARRPSLVAVSGNGGSEH